MVAKVNAKVAEGADVINLGQGNPDQPTYDHIVESLCLSAKNPASHKYSQFRGNRPFKEAAAMLFNEKTVMGSIWMQSVRFVSWVELKLD